MTGNRTDTGSTQSSDELSDAERAAVFAAANAHDTRQVAFQAGRIPVAPKVIKWSAAVIISLGLVGILGDHFFPGVGKATTTTSSAQSILSTTTPTSVTSTNSLVSLQAFMRLKFISTAAAANFTLTSQYNKPWKLSAQKGKVVVLTFYSSTCNDICPVVGAEFKEASQQLGRNSSRVEFVVVNSDPRHTRTSLDSAALRVPGLANVSSVKFLTGTIDQLNSVWTTYGVLVKVGAQANQVSHNNVLYFIDTQGNLAAYSVPFAQESSLGNYSLDAAILHRYAEGIAVTAESLLQ